MGEKFRGPFGAEIDLSEYEKIDLREVIAPVDLLRLEDTDPKYVYGWLDTGDPNTAYKIRKGVWEPVRADDLGGVKVPYHTSSEDGYVHVRELILVRMPKERYDQIQKAYVALSLRRHQALRRGYAEAVQDTARTISPGSDATPFSQEDITVKTESRRRR
jgi:hypothetical protein